MKIAENGLKISIRAIVVNIILAIVKITTGIVGNSYALIADGIESTMDIISSIIVWSSLRISLKPPDKDHPYGHGKAESIAGVLVSVSLLIAAGIIAIQSIREIQSPINTPAWYTLLVLVIIIIVKETLFKKMNRVGEELKSNALKSDAWHHRSDAITSAAVFVGISIALIGGKGYETADAWAALLACGIIAFNGIRLLIPAINEIMDAAAPEWMEIEVRRISSAVTGVVEIEKCRIRKSGLGLLMDIHVVVDGEITVREGHDIGHQVKKRLIESSLEVTDVTIHIEPYMENKFL